MSVVGCGGYAMRHVGECFYCGHRMSEVALSGPWQWSGCSKKGYGAWCTILGLGIPTGPGGAAIPETEIGAAWLSGADVPVCTAQEAHR